MDTPAPVLEQGQRRFGAFRPGDRIRLDGRIYARHSETVNSTKRSMCVLALFVLLLSVAAGGSVGRAAGAAEVKIPPTGNVGFTATLSPEQNADGHNNMATVALRARYKGH